MASARISCSLRSEKSLVMVPANPFGRPQWRRVKIDIASDSAGRPLRKPGLSVEIRPWTGSHVNRKINGQGTEIKNTFSPARLSSDGIALHAARIGAGLEDPRLAVGLDRTGA